MLKTFFFSVLTQFQDDDEEVQEPSQVDSTGKNLI